MIAPIRPEDIAIRPLGDMLLVLREKRAETLRGLIRPPTDSSASSIRTGIVLRVGPGIFTKKGKRAPVGIEPGERVVFHVWHVELKAGRALRKALANHVDDDLDICMIHPKDVLMVITGDHTLELP
jgi:co-chaperonin GroES (HSP10)